MTLKKSPRGHIKPYTREGVTSNLKKTAKDTAMMKISLKSLKPLLQTLKSSPADSEEAEDAMVELELLAIQMNAAAKSSIKELTKALHKTEKYLAENTK